MTERESDPRPVIRCSGTADFLAALPYLTGFTATDSLFVICFIGARSGPAVRIDLPRSDDPGDALAILDLMSELAHDLSAMHEHPVAVAVVIVSNASFDMTGPPPWQRLARRIERRLRRDGVEIRELCLLAADGWLSFLDPHPQLAGRPLSEIAESPVIRGPLRQLEAPVELQRLGEIPAADPARAAALARALEHHPPSDFPGSERVPPLRSESGSTSDSYFAWISEAAESTRDLCTDGPLSSDAAARLVRNSAHSDRWLIIALGLLTRPEFPLELAAELPIGRFTGVPVELEIDLPPLTDEPAAGLRTEYRANTSAGRERTRVAASDWSVFRILDGACPEFTEHGRLRGVLARLRETMSETPEPLRPGMLALSAWLWWLQGNQSVARRQAHEALAIDAGHELAAMVHRLTTKPLYRRLTATHSTSLGGARQTQSRRAAPR